MEKFLKKQAIKYAKHFSEMLNIPSSVIDADERSVLTNRGKDFISICRGCSNGKCGRFEQYMAGLKEAFRWDGLYIGLCPQEMVMICASISDPNKKLLGGIILGPMILENKEEMIARADNYAQKALLSRAVELPAPKIQSAAEVLAGITYNLSNFDPERIGRFFYRQDTFLNELYMEKMREMKESDFYTYPIAIERKLRQAIENRDKEASNTLLNQILANIYMSNDQNLEAIKPRIIELVVVISRAAMDAGADIKDIFLVNENYVEKIEKFTSIEDLSAWVSNILQRFLSFTFEYDKMKHVEVIYKVFEYIKNNYDKKITLDELAEETMLSRAYLSTLFKKETGYSISEYMNIVRVDKSKPLLVETNRTIVEIANMCGFEDQSYYTKVFRNIAGITPKKYRETRGKII